MTHHGGLPVVVQLPDQHLPQQSAGERLHVLDGTCWCRPTATTIKKRSALVHHAEAPTVALLGDLPPLVVRTPPKRSRWGRPWDRRAR